MEEQKKTFYITTAIPYANAGPHIGHAYEVVLTDILARYKRMRGFDTYFLSGTAEHGTKIIRAAEAAGLGPQAFVDGNVDKFLRLYEKLKVSNDGFIRNSDKDNHWPGAQELWRNMLAKGDIYKKSYKGLYCVGCEKFITSKELVEGKCPDHDKEPEEVEEENYFFKLSKYEKEITDLLESEKLQILPNTRVNELLAFVKEGLEDISFSRPEGDIPWGIPVPDDSSQMMYVWCEELSNYVSALGYGREDALFKKFWPADTHVVGKDILRFHAIVWPAMLLSAGLPVPKRILVHGMILSEGKKMSKTIGNVIDPHEYVEEFGSEALRYYLGREVSPFDDGDFTREKFIEVYNANLANGIGNLVSRTSKMASSYFDGKVTRALATDVPLRGKKETLTAEFEVDGFSIPHVIEQDILPRYYKHMDAYAINKAADVIWELVGLLDGYITTYEPFKLIKTNESETENILWNVLYGLEFVAEMLEPFMPESAKQIIAVLGAEISDGDISNFAVAPPEKPLFARIDS